MAKHMVKCLNCGQTFDANSVEYIKIKNRYAHKHCSDAVAAPRTQEELDLIALNDYIQSLFGDNANWAMIKKQLKTYKEEYKYTYSGILKTLKYWFEIKKNPKDKSNGAIGIVPYIYNDACNYYYNIYMAQAANQEKEYEHIVKVVTIKPPKANKILKRMFNLGD